MRWWEGFARQAKARLGAHCGPLGEDRLNACPTYLLPAAAEGFVDGDQVGDDGGVALGEIVFGGELLTLSVEHAEKVGEAAGVDFVGERSRLATGLDLGEQALAAVLFMAVSGERVLGFFERAKDRVLIGGESLI